MRVFAGIAAALLLTVLTGVGGQAAPGTEPQELPPADFNGNQYVDSAGCVFLRAGLAGQTTWVPRVNRDRQPVCGYEPTFAGTSSSPDRAPDTAVVAPEPAAAEPAPSAATPAATPSAPESATADVAPMPAKAMSAKGKKAAKPAAPKSVALVHQKSAAKSATYCADRIADAQRYLLSDGRRVTQCAAAREAAPVLYLNGLGFPGLQVSDRAPTAAEIRRAEATNQGAYRVTQAKGRLTRAGEAAMAAPAGGSPAADAAPYVQVGAFAEPANAERAIARLEGLGLPVSVGRDGGLTVILAGPFTSSAEASNALLLVRQNGYRDAFATRG
jgi:hypothetical protein